MANDININVVAQVQGAIAPLKAVEQQVRRVGGQIDQSTAVVRRNTMEYTRSGTQLRRWAKGALQQAGYQVGDFAVQVANGTNGIQAFGQQGSQLLGIFGPIGAVLGAAVAIFSAFAVAASKSGQEVQNFGSVLGSLRGPIEAASGTVREIGQSFGSVFPFILQNIDTAIIAAGLFAAIIGVKMVASMIASAGASRIMTAALVQVRAAIVASALSAGTFNVALVAMRSSILLLGGVLKAVGAIFMRFLPILVIVALAKFIEMVLAARNAVGSFGAVGALLKDVFLEVLERIRMGFALLGDEIYLTSQRLLSLVGLSSMTEDQMNAFRDSLNNSWSGLTGGLESWQRFMDAVRAGTEDVNIFGDAMGEMTDGAGGRIAELVQRVKALEDSITSSMEDAFMSIVDGTKSAKEAFKDMGRSIIAELYRVLVVQRMVASITGAMGLGGGKGTTFLSGLFGGFRAQGGSVQAGKSYVVGERGPEMFVPSTSGRIQPNSAMGGGGQTVVINQTINVSTGVQQTVRAEIKQLMPQIAESAKQAVVESKRRRDAWGRGLA